MNNTELHKILVEFNDTKTDYPHDKTIIDLFEEQVERTPENIAVVFEDKQLTYKELNNKSNQLANYLQTLGVKPEVLVGICVERSLEMVIGLLGILKAGGAYLPLDPAYPKSRLAFMLEDAQVATLLTQENLVKNLPKHQAQVVCLDTDWEAISKLPNINLIHDVKPNNLAYVIYTSGSTGKPKGVQIANHAVVNFLHAMQQIMKLTVKDNLLAVTTISFDIAVLELFLPLCFGAKVVVASHDTVSDGVLLSKCLEHHNITIMQATPVTWKILLAMGWKGNPKLQILVGGEPFSKKLAHQLLNKGSNIWNLYGPTEATVWSTYYKLNKDCDNFVPIGKPIANTQIYILDNNLQSVSIGIAGEIYIGGFGLSIGYFNRPKLTTERFIVNPYNNQCMYKTGDLARYLPDGNIEYIGRIDNQVKVRGFRIELGEIEAQIAHHPLVQETAVICSELETDDKRLIAYVVPKLENLNPTIDKSVQNSQIKQLSHWEQIWEHAYDNNSNQDEPTLNISGYNSSYTGSLILEEEIKVWIDSTVDIILSLKPKKVLEIGCGTGLLLSKIAPYCDEYLGTDFSLSALKQTKKLKKLYDNLNHVMLRNCKADDFIDIESEKFDTVIINSVIQYFPSIHYLIDVLKKAIKVIKPGGHIFIGDIRNLTLLKAYHTSIQLYQSSDFITKSELQQRIQQYYSKEEELLLDPKFFLAFQQHNSQITNVTIQPHRGRYYNELTKFRYQAILQVAGKKKDDDIPWVDWSNLTNIHQQLETKQVIGFRNVPNARLDTEIQTLEWLKDAEPTATVKQLREILTRNGIEPEDLWQLGEELGYKVEISWLNTNSNGCYDILFKSPNCSDKQIPLPNIHPLPWHHYANNPLHNEVIQNIIPKLRQYLQEQLPDYMVPALFVMLDTMPLTPNGKIDRNALPEPDGLRPQLKTDYIVPQTKTEQRIAKLWQQILKINKIGIHDNFFDLGGNSLLAVQFITKLNVNFQINLAIHSLLNAPTIAELIKLIEGNIIELPPNLVILQTGNSKKTPLFLMHPGGGHIYFYKDLVHHLDSDQPVHGIQAQGTYGNSKPLTKVEEMAAKYIEVIQIVQPEGPYLLGGACFGGVVALEMAKQLQELNQQIALLAVIDTPVPGQIPFKLKLHHYFEQIKMTIKMIPDWNVERLYNILKLHNLNYQAFLDYKPAIHSGKILFFSAKERNEFNTQFLEQAWSNLAAEGIDIYRIQGNHVTMNYNPHVKILSEQLMKHIEKVYI
ncbi:MAG: amino acid adenylation domain-containing protein [Candidatus Marithrix sp.]